MSSVVRDSGLRLQFISEASVHFNSHEAAMSNVEVAVSQRSQYVDFWNTVLVPKFVR
jgi:hypothetical protein